MTTELKEALAPPENVIIHTQGVVSGVYRLEFRSLTEDEVRKLVGFYKFIHGLPTNRCPRSAIHIGRACGWRTHWPNALRRWPTPGV